LPINKPGKIFAKDVEYGSDLMCRKADVMDMTWSDLAHDATISADGGWGVLARSSTPLITDKFAHNGSRCADGGWGALARSSAPLITDDIAHNGSSHMVGHSDKHPCIKLANATPKSGVNAAARLQGSASVQNALDH